MAAFGSASRISLFVFLWWVYPDGLSVAVLWRVWLSVLRPRCRTLRVHHSSLAWIWSLWKIDTHLCLDLSRIEKKYHSTLICIERDLITIRGVRKRLLFICWYEELRTIRDDGQTRSVLKLNHNGFMAQHCLVFIIYKRRSYNNHIPYLPRWCRIVTTLDCLNALHNFVWFFF